MEKEHDFIKNLLISRNIDRYKFYQNELEEILERYKKKQK